MKKIRIFALFFITVLALSACTQGKETSSNSQNISNKGNLERRRPDFGQPEENPDLRGLVSSIVGNEVTVLKFSRSGFNQNESEEGDNKATENNAEQRPTALGFGSTGGAARGPGFNRGFRSGEDNEDTREQMLERIKQMTDGEEKVLIPVGIRMLKPDTTADGGQPAMIEASLEDIKTDSMLSIWLDENVTDRQVAKFVLIMR